MTFRKLSNTGQKSADRWVAGQIGCPILEVAQKAEVEFKFPAYF